MPTLEISDPVLWYPDGTRGSIPSPAFVSRTMPSGILSLVVHREGFVDVGHKSGVYHVDDPGFKNLNSVRREQLGAWDYTPLYKRIAALEAKVAELADAPKEEAAKKAGYWTDERKAAQAQLMKDRHAAKQGANA